MEKDLKNMKTFENKGFILEQKINDSIDLYVWSKKTQKSLASVMNLKFFLK